MDPTWCARAAWSSACSPQRAGKATSVFPASCVAAVAHFASSLVHFSPVLSDPGSLPSPTNLYYLYLLQTSWPSVLPSVRPKKSPWGNTTAPRQFLPCEAVKLLFSSHSLPDGSGQLCYVPCSPSWTRLPLWSFCVKMTTISSPITPHHMHKTMDHCTVCNLFENLCAVVPSLL